MACCTSSDHKTDEKYQQLAEELGEMADDPTLQDCCRRDLEAQAKNASLKAKLSLHDRSEHRHRLAASVLKTNPPPPPNEEEDLELSDEDADLERLRALRLNELKAQAANKQQIRDVQTILEPSIHTHLAKSGTVLHLALEGSPVCDAVDECLSALAHRHPTLTFLRCPVRPVSITHTSLNLPPGPCIVCCTAEKKVVSASLGVFGAPEDFREERLERWLRKNMTAALKHDDDSEIEDSGSDDDDVSAPCEICGRTYPHEHVRSVYANREHIDSDEDSDFD